MRNPKANPVIFIACIVLIFGAFRPAASQDKTTRAADSSKKLDACVDSGTTANKYESLLTAKKTCEDALTVFQANKDKDSESIVIGTLGLIYEKLGDKANASNSFNRSADLAREVGKKGREAVSLFRVGKIYESVGEDARVADVFQRVLALSREVKDETLEARALHALGGYYFKIGDTSVSILHFQNSIAISKRIGELGIAASTAHYLGWLLREVGEYETALMYFNEALALNRAANRPAEAIMTLRNIGDTYRLLGDDQKALESLQSALATAEKVNSIAERGQCLDEIGRVYAGSGEYEKALEAYQKALALMEEAKNIHSYLGTMQKIGGLYDELGDARKSFQYYRRTMEYAVRSGDLVMMVSTFPNVTMPVIERRNENERKVLLSFGERILSVARENKDSKLEARMLDNLAQAFRAVKDYTREAEMRQQALALYIKQENKRAESEARAELAGAYFALGNKTSANDELAKALALSESSGNLDNRAYIFAVLAHNYSRGGEIDKANEHYKKSLQTFAYLDDMMGEISVMTRLMRLAERAKNTRLSIFYGKMTILRLQKLRSGIRKIDSETQKSFLKQNEDTYRALAHFLIRDNRLLEAHQVLNLFRDQQFFDVGGVGQPSIAAVALTPRESLFYSRYNEADEKLAAVARETRDAKRNHGSGTTPTTQMAQAETRLKAEALGFDTVLKDAEKSFSESPSSADQADSIGDTAKLQTALREIGKQTGDQAVAIYTLVGNDNFRVLVVTPDSVIPISQLIKGELVDKKSKQLWALLQSDKYDPRIAAKDVYDLVFKPIETVLPAGTRTLLWSLDKSLRFVPMAALFDGKQYLLERYNHVNFTRADPERLVKPASSNSWKGTGFGTSDAHTVSLLGDSLRFAALPGVSAEFDQVFKRRGAGILEGEVLEDKRFNRASMIRQLADKRPVVHIASHFSFRPGDEARSFLLLGDGTPFTIADMKKQSNMFAGVELLTLSACNTAAQQADADGREIDSFFELAQRLGAQSVLATLWPVADNSTPWLMREFYDFKINKRQSKAEALRNAQLSLLNGSSEARPSVTRTHVSEVEIVLTDDPATRDDTRSERFAIAKKDAPPFTADATRPFAHPFFWSPFVLIGNWR